MARDRRKGRVDALLERLLGERPRLLKFVKYSAASASGVITGQSTLLFCLLVLDLGAVTSNLLAVTIGSVPNYLINRAWTFNKQGAHSFTREVLPFWFMALLGLLLSTFTVAWAADRWDDNVLAISLANTAAFGVLWVAKYFVLDKVLFAPIAAAVEAAE
ncbi:GtrA family protein [Actinospongicola halichondriae]|uniref:GtrA family protein n=1 Tax=Actinospongicola halichondriae TaxID=3236844 RepID=UPI003D3995D6